MTFICDSKTGKIVRITCSNDDSELEQNSNNNTDVKQNDSDIILYTKLSHDRKTGNIIFPQHHNAMIFKAGVLPGTLLSEGFYKTEGRENPIKITVEMRSVGATLSKVYLSIDCFEKPTLKKEDNIPLIRGGMILNDGLTLKNIITDSVFSLNIPIVSDNANYLGFASRSNVENNYIGLAIFLDGNVNKLPDHLVVPKPKTALFEFKDDLISLITESIPVDILNQMIINKTIFRLHQGGGGYVYPLNWFIVPNYWETYTCIIDPKGNYSIDNKSLRMGTKYIKVGLLANYGQLADTKAELLVRNFSIFELE